jgi:hypothetical protein
MSTVNIGAWEVWITRWNTPTIANIYDVIHEYLSAGYYCRIDQGQRLIQLMIIPTNGQITSYEIFRGVFVVDNELKDHILLKTEWEFDKDFRIWRKEESISQGPTFKYYWKGIQKDKVAAIMANFQPSSKITITINDTYRSISDGTRYEIALGTVFHGIRYCFSSSLSSTWNVFKNSFYETIEYFDTVFSN